MTTNEPAAPAPLPPLFPTLEAEQAALDAYDALLVIDCPCCHKENDK